MQIGSVRHKATKLLYSSSWIEGLEARIQEYRNGKTAISHDLQGDQMDIDDILKDNGATV